MLVGESLLGYSEKTGYKIESSAGQEWQQERDRYAPTAEQVSEKIIEQLGLLLGDAEKPSLAGAGVPWLALFSDEVRARDVHIKDERKHTVVTADFQFTRGERADVWVPRSDSPTHRDRIVWVVGDVDGPRHAATKLVQSERMIERYAARQSSMGDDKQRLLIDERSRRDAAQGALKEAVMAAFMAGELYFRGRQRSPRSAGATFITALGAFGNEVVRELYPHPTTARVLEKDIVYLIDNAELSARLRPRRG